VYIQKEVEAQIVFDGHAATTAEPRIEQKPNEVKRQTPLTIKQCSVLILSTFLSLHTPYHR
jgi:hypothetical protein